MARSSYRVALNDVRAVTSYEFIVEDVNAAYLRVSFTFAKPCGPSLAAASVFELPTSVDLPLSFLSFLFIVPWLSLHATA